MSETVLDTTAQRLHDYVGAAGSDAAFINDCAREADALVARHVGAADVPDEILDRARVEVAADLYHRRQTRNGLTGFDGDNAVPVYVSRDPLRAVYSMLAPYLGPGIA